MINKLNKIGLTDSEAKVYLTLLKSGPISGYEASKRSGVPRSKIYNVLESLTVKGFILYSEIDENFKYTAVPFVEISEKTKRETENVLNELEEELKDFDNDTELDYIWHIKKYNNIFAKCRTLINAAEEELLVQVWDEELSEIEEDLLDAEKNGIKLAVVYFSDKKAAFKNYVNHGLKEQKIEEFGGRWIAIVADNKEAIFGQILNKNSAEVIWTKSKPMIAMAAEYVRHDMYFYNTAQALEELMKEKYGVEYKKIRDIF